MLLYSYCSFFFGSEHSTEQHKGQTPYSSMKIAEIHSFEIEIETSCDKKKAIQKLSILSCSDESVKVADYLLPWNMKIQICPQFFSRKKSWWLVIISPITIFPRLLYGQNSAQTVGEIKTGSQNRYLPTSPPEILK